MELRHDWTREEIRAIHDLPLMDLVYRAQTVHRAGFGEHKVQLASLLSVKTGGCPEDCAYCPQSAGHHAEVEVSPLMQVDDVLAEAKVAKDAGASRFCMGAAWRDAPENAHFERVLEMVRGVRALGMEACVTLGMLTEDQAQRLADAGLTAYNHNLDTSPEFYDKIVHTRTYEERLVTLKHVRQAGVELCSGGIIGMGESVDDRVGMLEVLAGLDPHPESVPINALVPVAGTPLAGRPRVDTVDLVRMIATARILMPRSMVRLSAGRMEMSEEAQILCFFAGANSVFFGDRLLTTGNPAWEADQALLKKAGIAPLDPETDRPAPETDRPQVESKERVAG